MKYVFLFLVLAFIIFYIWSLKFNNPYKLVFIFGKKGAGKSTLMVSDMKKDLKKGWNVYTDMQDCILEGVRIFNIDDLGKFIPPPHSAIYIDEGGIKFDNRNFKNFPPELRDYFKYQRKYKNKVVMNSQSFDIDKKIRDVTDSMILQTSLFNVFTLSRPIKRSVTLVDASAQGDSRIADNLRFCSILDWRIKYMPKYFKYFESFKAPERPFLKFREIPKTLNKIKQKNPIKALKLDFEDDEDE